MCSCGTDLTKDHPARRLPGVPTYRPGPLGPSTGACSPYCSQRRSCRRVDATIANVATPSIRTSLGASGASAELIIGGYLIAYATLLITGARLSQARVPAAVPARDGRVHGQLPAGRARTRRWRARRGASPAGSGRGHDVPAGDDRYSADLRRTGAGAGDRLVRDRVVGRRGSRPAGGRRAGGGRPRRKPMRRAIFLVNVPVCLAAVCAAAARCLPVDGERVAAGLDLPGVGLLAASVLLIVVPLVVGQQQGWPAWAWICLAAAVPGFGLFLTTQRRAAAEGHPGAGQPRRRPSRARRPRAHRAGRGHLDLLRPAVHAGPVRAAGDGPQPGRLRPGPGALGRRLWPGRAVGPPRPGPDGGGGARGRLRPADPRLHLDQPQPVRRRAQRRAAAGPARGRRFRSRPAVRDPDRACDERRRGPFRGRHQRRHLHPEPARRRHRGRRHRQPLPVRRADGRARATHAAAIATAAMAAVAVVAALAAYRATRPRAPIAERRHRQKWARPGNSRPR